MPGPHNHLCLKHGGDRETPDDFWLCDTCARNHINNCACGAPARYFGEALMCAVSCEQCKEFVMYVGFDKDVRKLWNEGVRGNVDVDG